MIIHVMMIIIHHASSSIETFTATAYLISPPRLRYSGDLPGIRPRLESSAAAVQQSWDRGAGNSQLETGALAAGGTGRLLSECFKVGGILMIFCRRKPWGVGTSKFNEIKLPEMCFFPIREAHHLMGTLGREADSLAFNASLKAMAAAMAWGMVVRCFSSMTQKRVVLDWRSRMPILSSCSRALMWARSYHFLRQQQLIKIRPDEMAICAAMNGSTKAGYWKNTLNAKKCGCAYTIGRCWEEWKYLLIDQENVREKARQQWLKNVLLHMFFCWCVDPIEPISKFDPTWWSFVANEWPGQAQCWIQSLQFCSAVDDLDDLSLAAVCGGDVWRAAIQKQLGWASTIATMMTCDMAEEAEEGNFDAKNMATWQAVRLTTQDTLKLLGELVGVGDQPVLENMKTRHKFYFLFLIVGFLNIPISPPQTFVLKRLHSVAFAPFFPSSF